MELTALGSQFKKRKKIMCQQHPGLRSVDSTFSTSQQKKPLYYRFASDLTKACFLHLPPLATGPKTRRTSGSGEGICSTLLKVICKVLGLAKKLPVSPDCSNGIIPSAGREELQPSLPPLPCRALPSGDAYPCLQPYTHIYWEKQILKLKIVILVELLDVNMQADLSQSKHSTTST